VRKTQRGDTKGETKRVSRKDELRQK
jgi:hypothetical protein